MGELIGFYSSDRVKAVADGLFDGAGLEVLSRAVKTLMGEPSKDEQARSQSMAKLHQALIESTERDSVVMLPNKDDDSYARILNMIRKAKQAYLDLAAPFISMLRTLPDNTQTNVKKQLLLAELTS